MAKDLENEAVDSLDPRDVDRDVGEAVTNSDIPQTDGFKQKVPGTENSVDYYTTEGDTKEDRDVPVSPATGSLENFGR